MAISDIRSESRLLRPVSLRGCDATKTVDRNPRHDQDNPKLGLSGPCIQRAPVTQRKSRKPFSARFLAHPGVRNRGQKIPRPLPPLADGFGHRGPFWELPAGKQNASAPNKGRLGHLRRARQGLVRLSESNTKYGGKLGKTGAKAAPVNGPSIGESWGIPKLKKTCSPSPPIFSPALHRQPPYSPPRACIGETQASLRNGSGLA